MRSTGIVRRIDELGRIVIPKEVRTRFRIKEGDALEIYFDDNENGIFLKKYSPLAELSSNDVQKYVDSLHETMKGTYCICDRDTIIAVAGDGKDDLLDKSLTHSVIEIMRRRTLIKGLGDIKIVTSDTKQIYFLDTIIPIVADDDLLGALLMIKGVAHHGFDTAQMHCAEVMVNIIGKQLEQ